MLSIVLTVIAVICGLVLIFYLLSIFFKRRQFINKFGSWDEIERRAWHGDLVQFKKYYLNAKQYKRAGVYIHRNLTNGKVYVGQSKNIFSRVNSEINGQATNSGCKLLYDDYKAGDKFQITLIFKKAGYPCLNKLERVYINKYESYNKKYGYNATYGNDELTGETLYK